MCDINPRVVRTENKDTDEELIELFEHLRKFANTRVQVSCQKCDVNNSKFNSRNLRNMPLSQFLENIMDLTTTIIEIMVACGIERRQAERTNDVIISALLYFEEIPTHKGLYKKKIQKVNLLNDLKSDIPMTGSNAYLTYIIVKCAFQAFYFNQTVRYYNPTYINDKKWQKTVNKICQSFATLTSGKTCSHYKKVKALIKKSIELFVDRVKRRNQSFPKLPKSNSNENESPLRTLGYRPTRMDMTLCPVCETMRKSPAPKDRRKRSALDGNLNNLCEMDKWIKWLNCSPLNTGEDIGYRNVPCTAVEIKNELMATRRKARTLRTADEINDYINSQRDPCNRCTLPFEQVLDLEPVNCLNKIEDNSDEPFEIKRTRNWNQFAYDMAKTSDLCLKCAQNAPDISSVPCSKCRQLGRETCYQMTAANEPPPPKKQSKPGHRSTKSPTPPKSFAVNVRNTYVIRRRLDDDEF